MAVTVDPGEPYLYGWETWPHNLQWRPDGKALSFVDKAARISQERNADK